MKITEKLLKKLAPKAYASIRAGEKRAKGGVTIKQRLRDFQLSYSWRSSDENVIALSAVALSRFWVHSDGILNQEVEALENYIRVQRRKWNMGQKITKSPIKARKKKEVVGSAKAVEATRKP